MIDDHGWQVRGAVVADAGLLTRLVGDGAEAARTRPLIADPARFIPVAQSGAELVGYAEAQYYGPALRRGFGVLRLHDLFVDPRWRRQGVATALFDAVEGWARALPGCRFVEWQAGTQGVAFYEGPGATRGPGRGPTAVSAVEIELAGDWH